MAMKNTKRHATTASAPTPQRATATGKTNTNANAPSTNPTRRRAASVTQPKGPTLATAARRHRNSATSASPTTPTKPPTSAAQRRKSSHADKKNKASLVHDAVRRAFHASTAAPSTPDECARLRDELVRVMADHERQADEIVALRALAKSLKEEVEAMQEEQTAEPLRRKRDEPTTHEFFQLDARVDALQEENTLLRARLDGVEREKRELEDVLDREIPRCELLAVQARAELESTASQLRDEQQENDRLRTQVAYYKARSRSPVRLRPDKENRSLASNLDTQALDASLHDSLLSSVASFSMSAASAFSSQLHDDVHKLKTELRQLHRTIDASVLSAHGGARSRLARTDQDEKTAT